MSRKLSVLAIALAILVVLPRATHAADLAQEDFVRDQVFGGDSALTDASLVRDQVLTISSEGKELRKLYRVHIKEVLRILMEHEDIRKSVATLIAELTPQTQNAISSHQMVLTRAQVSKVRKLLQDASRIASDDLKGYINRLHRVSRSEASLARLGIKVIEAPQTAPPGLKRHNLTTMWGAIKQEH